MDISSINQSMISQVATEATSSQQSDEFQKLLDDSMNMDDEALKDACRQYESYFIKQVFTEMRNTIPESDLLESSAGRDMYEDMLDDEYAKEMSKGEGTGIAQMLYEQLSKEITKID